MKEVIGIVGPRCAGKDVAGEYLGKKLDIPIFRTESKLTSEIDDNYLIRQIIKNSLESRILITDMRRLGQVALLNEKTRLFLLSVDAASEIRYERSCVDEKYGDIKKLDGFRQRRLFEGDSNEVLDLYECMQAADFEIINNDGLYYFQKKLDQAIDLANEKFSK